MGSLSLYLPSDMSRPVVLVTSATGRIGKEVVARLCKSGKVTVRAGSHTVATEEEYLKKLGAHQVVNFDLTNKDTWETALKDVEAVYSASPDPLLEHHISFSGFLGTLKGKLKHVVRISCMGADTITASYDPNTHVSRDGVGIPVMLQHYWWAERALVETGLPLTVIRANFFMNHLLKTDTDKIDNEGWFSNPLGKTRNSFVCTNDLGEAASICLLEGPEKHAAKFYDITGPAPQNMDEVAADLSKVMGKTVVYKPQVLADFEKDFGPTRAAFFEYLTNGFYTRCSPDFYNLTGRKPTSYAEYLVNKGAAGETGMEELYQANMWKKGEDAMKAVVSAVGK